MVSRTPAQRSARVQDAGGNVDDALQRLVESRPWLTNTDSNRSRALSGRRLWRASVLSVACGLSVGPVAVPSDFLSGSSSP